MSLIFLSQRFSQICRSRQTLVLSDIVDNIAENVNKINDILILRYLLL